MRDRVTLELKDVRGIALVNRDGIPIGTVSWAIQLIGEGVTDNIPGLGIVDDVRPRPIVVVHPDVQLSATIDGVMHIDKQAGAVGGEPNLGCI